MDLNGFTANNVESQVGFDNKDTIPEFCKFFISGDSAEKLILSQFTDMLVEFFNERGGSGWIIICDPVKN